MRVENRILDFQLFIQQLVDPFAHDCVNVILRHYGMISQNRRQGGFGILVGGMVQGKPGVELNQLIVGVGGSNRRLAAQEGEIVGDLLVADPFEERKGFFLLGGTAADSQAPSAKQRAPAGNMVISDGTNHAAFAEIYNVGQKRRVGDQHGCVSL